MRLKCVGTMKALVTRWRAISASAAAASKWGMITAVPPISRWT